MREQRKRTRGGSSLTTGGRVARRDEDERRGLVESAQRRLEPHRTRPREAVLVGVADRLDALDLAWITGTRAWPRRRGH